MKTELSKNAKRFMQAIPDSTDLYLIGEGFTIRGEMTEEEVDAAVEEVEQFMLNINKNPVKMWNCPHMCGRRVEYGTSCAQCASRHEPIGEEEISDGIGISEIANKMEDGYDEDTA